MWWGYKAAGKAIGGGARAGGRVGEQLGARAASAASLRAASKGAKRGYLVPGDPTPPPTAPMGYLDYRGIAEWQEVRMLEDGQFPIGMAADLRRGRFRGPIGLPGEVLNRHALVIGPAGSGKTYSVLLPWIYAAAVSGWSVVAVDVKGDLRDLFIEFKRLYGDPAVKTRIHRWDFFNPGRSVAWEWLAELNEDARVDAAVTAILGKRPEGNADPYFYQRDYRTLRGMFKFVRLVAPNLRTATDVLRVLQDDQLLDGLVRRHPHAPGAADLQAVLRFPPADYPKVVAGVVTALSALDNDGVNAVTQAAPGRTTLDLATALDEPGLLIVGAPLRGGQISETLSSLLLNQLAQRLYERFTSAQRPVLLVLDEAKTIAGRVDLAKLMEVSRSAGVGVVVACQDLLHFADGSDRSSIMTNAATCVMLPGASAGSVQAFSERLGERYEQTFGLSDAGPRGGFGAHQPNQSFGTEVVPVLRAREISQPPFGARPAIVQVNAAAQGIVPKPLVVDLER